MKISSLIERLERWVPPDMAESWDASGLQVGNPDNDAEAVFLCLDISETTLNEAIEFGANLVLSHHPMLFSPLKTLDVRTGVGRLVHVCLTHDLTVYSLHTNLDKAAGGMNDEVAQRLGIGETEVLIPSTQPDQTHYKLVTFVPEEEKEALLKALFEAGGGRIGAYEGCSFSTPGEGTFFAGEETSPVVGEKGVWNRVPEVRIEVLFPAANLERGIAALMMTHPYEEPAYDIYPLHTPASRVGFGRVGTYDPPLPWEAFLARIREALGVDDFRIVGDPVERVSRVAVCTGSGASFISQAARRAQVYLTGDVKFHEAQEAEALGLTVVDAGHFALERIFVDILDRWLEEEGLKRDLKVYKSTGERDPFIFFHKGEDL